MFFLKTFSNHFTEGIVFLSFKKIELNISFTMFFLLFFSTIKVVFPCRRVR